MSDHKFQQHGVNQEGGKKSILNTIIIGASASGLACAACLVKRGIPFLVLDMEAQVGGKWRNHYDRLHLNTEKYTSALPYLPFPRNTPVYPSRDEVVTYMETYAKEFGIKPVFNTQVTSLERVSGNWQVKTKDKNYEAKHVILATGLNFKPFSATWPGMDKFRGQILHSSAYKNGSTFTNKQVLVVGFGNSACEISICLHENGAFPSMSVKGPVNIVPRDAGSRFMSIVINSLAFVSKLFPEMVDKMNAPVLHKKYGDYAQYGLEKLPYGPNVQTIRHKRVPLLDIGTIDLIKNGHVKVYPGISHFTEEGVVFANGVTKAFDALILATGFRPGITSLLPAGSMAIDETGLPVTSGSESNLSNLFFCGFTVSPSGMLNQIGQEAKKIAAAIKAKSRR